MVDRSVVVKTRLEWGKPTRDEKGAGRRIVVYGFPPQATIDDFIAFFGPAYSLEGMTIFIKRELAFIQYKRPRDASSAISKNGFKFMGVPIQIKPYEKQQKSKKDPQKDKSRSRSISPYIEPDMFEEELADDQLTSSPTQIYERERDEGMNRAWEEYNSKKHAAENPATIPLPDDVNLTMRLVLAQRTASNLSMHQIQSIITHLIRVRDSIKPSTIGNSFIHMDETLAHQSSMQDDQQARTSSTFRQQAEPRQTEPQPQSDDIAGPSGEQHRASSFTSQFPVETTEATPAQQTIDKGNMIDVAMKIREALGR